MNKSLLLFIFLCFSYSWGFSQCNDLFISQYLEGSSNNRALELYNASDNVIDLSEYSVGRFRNGSNVFTGGQIPSGYSIGPDETFVIVIDKRDSLGTGFEAPVWNGYLLMEPSIDTLTGEVRLDNNGDTILYPVFNEQLERYEYSSYYREKFDLQSKADIFVNPVYQQNTSFFYFNGDDAVALIKGTEITTGENIIDVVGVIGENPETTTGNPYWTDGQGRRMTQNSTLIRRATIEQGTGVVVAAAQDTFPYGEWIWRPNNTFEGLGEHLCACHDPISNTETSIESFNVVMNNNPIKNNTLSFSMDEPVESVIIFDNYGRTVQSFSGYFTDHFSKNVHLSSGIYFVQIQSSRAERVIKNIIVN